MSIILRFSVPLRNNYKNDNRRRKKKKKENKKRDEMKENPEKDVTLIMIYYTETRTKASLSLLSAFAMKNSF